MGKGDRESRKGDNLMGSCIYEKYKPDSNFQGKKVLNLGCGSAKYKAKNVVNMDAYESCNPDVLWDANKVPLPFEDNTFDLILANHILEHLENWWECFEDCARILKDGGVIQIFLPGEGNDTQMGYRDHVSKINQHSFYGVFDLRRPATNAWAMEHAVSPVNRLKCFHYGIVVEKHKWIKYVPKFLYNWCNLHLRNFAMENQFFYKKISMEEYERTKGVEWGTR